MHTKNFLVFCFVFFKFSNSYACSIEGIDNWLLPVTLSIKDTERNVFFRRSTSSITGISSVTNSEDLNAGPYISVVYDDSEFTIAPNDQFQNYEKYETIDTLGVTVAFRCAGGSENILIFVINIIDTNNHAPEFLPNANYHFKVAPPLPPGFLITDCVNDITVRDIDLTTQRIDFQMADNPYFEIISGASTVPKEFKAILRTTTFIRRISEPIVLWISATDVDLTGDDPLTTNGTVRIDVDGEFEFPDDLIFSETFYLASYTDNGQILLQNDIYLQQGYDADVTFSLEGDHKNFFDIDADGNHITLIATSQLPTDLLLTQIFLTLRASREYTSGATAAIIVNFPEGPSLQFEKSYYKGSIENNSLVISNFILEEYLENTNIIINIYGDFNHYFSASIQEDIVTLHMNPLEDHVIKDNNILTLQVVATANNMTARTVVVLEIIKEDHITPIFERTMYNASYDSIIGVTVEDIIIIQGYDDTVVVSLTGEYKNYFQIIKDGPVLNINSLSLPSHALNQQRLLLTVTATKPRTVGAHTIVYISMPQARALAFKSLNYSGLLVNSSVILETIELSTGYGEDVAFFLMGEYAQYFAPSNDGNKVTLSALAQLPENLIFENNFLVFTLIAMGDMTDTARTTILLEIIKQDIITPVFNQHIYHGRYLDALTVNVENIFLIQGFDENVSFRLSGDYAHYFAINYEKNNVSISLGNVIPEELIFNEKVLIFNILADKSLTVGANAAVSINFPRELTEPGVMRFSKNTYSGYIANEGLTVESILLAEGFRPQTEYVLSGDYISFFTIAYDKDNVTILLNEELPKEIIENNNFIILEIKAYHPRTIPNQATIVIEIMKPLEPIIIIPVFEHPYYYGQYSEQNQLQFNNPILLKEGYDENVNFKLEGENSTWFVLTPIDHGVSLILSNPLPTEVVANTQQLIFVITAEIINSSISAQSAIFIELKNENDNMPELGFEKSNYIGVIDNNTVHLEPITLVQGFSPDVSFLLHGEMASYFTKTTNGATVSIHLEDAIPEDVLPDNRIIILELLASAPRASSASVTIVLEIIQYEIPSHIYVLKFTETYYTGFFNVTEGLVFNQIMTLSEGYDDNVQFTLNGENSIWFGLVSADRGVTLSLTSPIPASVLAENQQLIFEISANKPSNPFTARSAIIITIPGDSNTIPILGFGKTNYIGSINNTDINLEPIILTNGFTSDVEFSLYGELSSYFNKIIEGATVLIQLENAIPENDLPDNRIIILELLASAPQALSTSVTIVLEIIRNEETPSHIDLLKFTETYYTGIYNVTEGLDFDQIMTLSEGYDDNVQFTLNGDSSVWFGLVPADRGVTLSLTSPIPASVLAENQQLIFEISANKPSNPFTARSAIIITISGEVNTTLILGFGKTNYVGSINGTDINLEPIVLTEGFTPDVEFVLYGELASYFTKIITEATVLVQLENTIPEDAIPDNIIIILELLASAPQAISTSVTIVLEIIRNEEMPSQIVILKFTEAYYIGVYNVSEDLVFNQIMTLSEGYDDNVQFTLNGDSSIWFGLVPADRGVTLSLTSPIPASVLANNRQLIFEISANKPSSTFTARSAIMITFTQEINTTHILEFEKSSYTGSLDNVTVNLELIILAKGFTPDVQFSLYGEMAFLFIKRIDGAVITLLLQDTIPEETLLNLRVIVLEIEASAPNALPSYTTVVLEVVQQNQQPIGILKFKQAFYTGLYTIADGLKFDHIIALAEGNDENIEFALEGDHSEWFSLEHVQGGLVLVITASIPPAILSQNLLLIFTITAKKPGSINGRSTIVISLPNESDHDVSFNQLLYFGILKGSDITHDNILVSGYNGTNVDILGDHANFFGAEIISGVVTVKITTTTDIPANTSYVVLELHVPGAGSVLILNVIDQANPVLPSVTFSSESYVIQVDISQTGLIGLVTATADNGEAVTYSLQIENAELRERLSINSNGELHLTAPASSGQHTFRAVATSVITLVDGTATVVLTVESTNTCSNEMVVPPLIVIDRDEESPHQNLVILNSTIFKDCRYQMTNRWPVDQTWLYVDENGLHTRAIDREHESIAFMALSQIQVELTLHCDTDETGTRNKRSTSEIAVPRSLGPYDYGSHKWVLTDTILYNARRSFVNLIVNDINDNDPIFILKENEPIAVGYPLPELEEIVSPRALVELKATDADIGENAALVFWSSEPVLAVSPSTGNVHVRNTQHLENGAHLTVHATDRNGQGRTGSLDLIVRLLNVSHIAVVTVDGAFLEDEQRILTNISSAIGYEVKTLRSVVVSMESDSSENGSRKERDATISTGALLELYIYGLIDREPVEVSQLTTDINNIIMSNIARTVSLKDHLESREICPIPARDTGLLASTISLSILLFILFVAIAVWFFLKWRKKNNYAQFSDQNSLASRDQLQQPTKSDELPKPRLNLDDLKRSERRLQGMLDAPVRERDISVRSPEPEVPTEIVVNVSTPEQRMPIVIQSIDKLKDAAETSDDGDEFGETQKARRKSVVTFNENVEKIIHLEDNPNDTDYEVYRF